MATDGDLGELRARLGPVSIWTVALDALPVAEV